MVKGLNQRKVKIFLVFLICSFLAWFISNLSDPYDSRVNFNLKYKDLPDTLLVSENAEKTIEAKVTANGFQFLYYNFNPKEIALKLSDLNNNKSRYYLSNDQLKREMEKQLPNNVKLIELDRDTFFLDLYKVTSKEVPINPNITLSFDQNYLLDGKLHLNPAMITLKGPESEIGAIDHIMTAKMEWSGLSADFSNTVTLSFPENLTNTKFSTTSTKISGTVVRFSEQIFEVDIQVIGVPEGYRAKTFPNAVQILCKASIERLKEIDADDFDIIADYNQARSENKMFLNLQRRPKNVYDVRFLENQVEFILEKL